MRASRRITGTGLLCSNQGIIVRSIYDGLGLGRRISPGHSFASLLEASSTDKGAHFLSAIRKNGTAEDWPLKIVSSRGTLPLRFWGSARNGFLHIVGATTAEAFLKIQHQFEVKTRRPHRGSRDAKPAASAEKEDLRRRNAELESLVEERTRWLSMAAHDLLHPIGAVLACSELLTQDDAPTLGPDETTLLSSIHSSAEAMLKMLNDISAMSLLESMKLRLSFEPIDLCPLIRESMSLNVPLAAGKHIKFELECADNVPPIALDRQRMLSVFTNIFENATKYCQDGAVVRTHIALEGADVVIAIADNGPGIPPDERDRLFTPFQKTRARAASTMAGTGLGLAISKRIVERHRGKIWVESTVSVGSTFYISLPTPVSE